MQVCIGFWELWKQAIKCKFKHLKRFLLQSVQKIIWFRFTIDECDVEEFCNVIYIFSVIEVYFYVAKNFLQFCNWDMWNFQITFSNVMFFFSINVFRNEIVSFILTESKYVSRSIMLIIYVTYIARNEMSEMVIN